MTASNPYTMIKIYNMMAIWPAICLGVAAIMALPYLPVWVVAVLGALCGLLVGPTLLVERKLRVDMVPDVSPEN